MPSVGLAKTFLKNLRDLPPDRQEGVKRAIEKFIADPRTPSLDFRPLKGSTGHFIIDGRRGDRIVLQRTNAERYEAVDVGPHDNVYRRWDR